MSVVGSEPTVSQVQVFFGHYHKVIPCGYGELSFLVLLGAVFIHCIASLALLGFLSGISFAWKTNPRGAFISPADNLYNFGLINLYFWPTVLPFQEHE